MQEKTIILDYEKRLHEIMNLSWEIFKSQFVNHKYVITKEAPFQFHFADIIRQVGNLYCFSQNEIFNINLETKYEQVRTEKDRKYIDITCGYTQEQECKCAIELKFKTQQQSAQDHGRIDSYIDIESLEILVLEKQAFSFGKFYMITDSKTYINRSKKGAGIDFPMSDGMSSLAQSYESNYIGRKGITINLRHTYNFNWETIEDSDKRKWYFLELTIHK